MNKFKKLLISNINEEIQGTLIERLAEVRQRFESEMVHKNAKPSDKLCTEWLQGLCSTIEIPWENYYILQWYESTMKRRLEAWRAERFLDKYWSICGSELYSLLYTYANDKRILKLVVNNDL